MVKIQMTLREAYNRLQREIGFKQQYQTFCLWAANDVGVDTKKGINYPIDDVILHRLRVVCEARKNTIGHIGCNKQSKLFALREVQKRDRWSGQELLQLLTTTRTISKAQLYRRVQYSTRNEYSKHEATNLIVGLTTAIQKGA